MNRFTARSLLLQATILAFFSLGSAVAQVFHFTQHEPPQSVQSGNRIVIAVQLTDDVSVDTARVYFRAEGVHAFSVILLESNGAEYVGTLPAPASGPRFLEYMVLVRNTDGEIRTSDTHRIEIEDSATSRTYATPLAVYTESSVVPSEIPGFTDNLAIRAIDPDARYGTAAGVFGASSDQTSAQPAVAASTPATTTPPSTAGMGSSSGIGTLGIVGVGALVAGLAAAGGGGGSDAAPALAANRPPTFAATGPLALSVAEGTTGQIAEPITAMDPDGDRLTYSLGGPDAEAFEVDSATAQLSVGESTTLNYEAQTAYTVEVRTSDGNLTASRTVEISITDVDEPPGQVRAPTVSPESESQLRITWLAPENTGPDITGFHIRHRKDGQTDWTAHVLPGTATVAVLTGLSIRTRYEVQVRAVNDEGLGDWSPASEALTNEPPWWNDWLALVDFYRATDGHSWRRDDNWSDSAEPPTAEELDTWFGVTVTNNRVTRLELDRNALKGSLPASLSGLTALEDLWLPHNDLTGPIPPELGDMSALSVLGLHDNALTGPIPVELGKLSKLSLLSLGGNALSGIIPPELGNLSTLVSLYLQDNALTGAIPLELGKLSPLQSLHLDRNMLTGTVPAEFGNLSRLETLYMDANKLSGPLPESLVNLAALSDFQWGSQTPPPGESPLCASTDEAFQDWLAGVPIRFGPNCGTVSGGLEGDWRALVALYNATDGANWRNNFNWSASDSPPTAAELDNWYGVTVSDNRVSHLHLQANSLSGPIPGELGELSELVFLVIHDNALTGPIPEELGNLSRLRGLFLHRNQLMGSIPDSLGNLIALESLWLQDNGLTGSIPSELGDLASLVQLDLRSNSLSGAIPRVLGNLSKLQGLGLDNNDLSGAIPPELGDLTSLVSLSLHANKFTGSLPSDLRHLRNLGVLTWGGQAPDTLELALCAPGDSDFQDWIWNVTADAGGPNCPKSGTLVTDWRALVALYNALNGTTWNRNDGWSGYDAMPEPDELNSWYGVTVRDGRIVGLDLRSNGLRGPVPLELGNLSALESLDVSSNSLVGPLPPGLVNVGGLDVLRWADQSVAAGVVALCAPMDESFQRWLEGIPDQAGPVCEAIADSLREDWEALVELYRSTDGANWRNNENWSGSDEMPTAEELDTWHGITVRDGRVAEVDLEGNGLSGPLPAVLANLSSLGALNLRTNDLTGPISSELGALIHLESLFLDGNQLTGPIPPELGALSRVVYLFMGENDLTGALPATLGNLSRVEYLSLAGNALTGPTPHEWGGMTRLIQLNLARNSISGPIPPALGKLSRLDFLGLNDNALTGGVPSEFGDLSRLRALWLRTNALTGPLPGSLTKLNQLLDLNWSDQSVMPGEQPLCAPTDAAFQEWVSRLRTRSGPDCVDTSEASSANPLPEVLEVSLISEPGPDGTYGAGEAVEVAIRFSQVVTVSGAPSLQVKIGTATAKAMHVTSGAGRLHSFRYVVSLGDHDLDGISVGPDALEIDGGAFRSESGAAASTDLGARAIINAPDHIVDARVPGAERAVLTDVLAAQGRAILASSTGVIGERFHGQRSSVGSGLIGEVANTLRGPHPVASGLSDFEPRSAPRQMPDCRANLLSAAERTCANDSLLGTSQSAAPAFGQSSTGLPWGRAFALPLRDTGSSERGGWTLWGTDDVQSFNGDSVQGGFDGDLRSVYLGVDGRLTDRWLAGAAVSRSRSETAYDFSAGGTSGAGTLFTNLTSIYPYHRWNGPNGWSTWGIGGVGLGEASVQRTKSGTISGPIESAGLRMGLVAAGARRKIVTLGSLDISLIADTGQVRLTTTGDSAVLDGLSASISRIRVGIEGEHTLALAEAGSLQPYWQLVGRYDAGDGHTGTRLELAGGLRYATPRIEFQVKGRWLAVRSGDVYEEFGASASLEFTPRPDGLGLSATLQQNWGNSGGGAQSMWRAQTLHAAYGHADRRTPDLWSTDARVDHAIALPGTAGHLTPFGEFRLAGESPVRARAGVQLERGIVQRPHLGLELGLGLVERTQQRTATAIDISFESRF